MSFINTYTLHKVLRCWGTQLLSLFLLLIKLITMVEPTIKTTEAWSLVTSQLGKHTLYHIFTKKGHYRWGKIYSHDKWFIILSWSCELLTEEDSKESITTIVPWATHHIPAWIPNLFFFPEDAEMIEWFDSNATATKYDKFYAKKTKESL